MILPPAARGPMAWGTYLGPSGHPEGFFKWSETLEGEQNDECSKISHMLLLQRISKPSTSSSYLLIFSPSFFFTWTREVSAKAFD
jgi:hypothetical protein